MGAASLHIEKVTQEHFPAIAKIYAEGLATGLASFETQVPDWNTWNAKFLQAPRFVLKVNQTVVGWAALSAVSKRIVYKGVAENTVYITKNHQQKGLGSYLLKHLIKESENLGFWTLQASIFSQNTGSISLHKKCGFKIVGLREKIAQRNNIWYDNILMERRSTKL